MLEIGRGGKVRRGIAFRLYGLAGLLYGLAAVKPLHSDPTQGGTPFRNILCDIVPKIPAKIKKIPQL
jgi:hypothetical protein